MTSKSDGFSCASLSACVTKLSTQLLWCSAVSRGKKPSHDNNQLYINGANFNRNEWMNLLQWSTLSMKKSPVPKSTAPNTYLWPLPICPPGCHVYALLSVSHLQCIYSIINLIFVFLSALLWRYMLFLSILLNSCWFVWFYSSVGMNEMKVQWF